jgi:lactate dehydrogenase-like 2-hydroxyacid dehydrogenase
MPADLWTSLPNLGLIASFGVGLDRIDLNEAKRRHVRVTYTPDTLTDDVADLAIGLILASLRKICAGDRFVRTGQWSAQPFVFGRSLKGRKLGILGLGRIGSAIARRAAGFGPQIAYHGRNQKHDVAYTYYANVEELAAFSDILCVCTPGGVETRHLIDAGVLSALGRDGYLINISRGSAVDEGALIEALRTHAIAGAALDVFENEPAINLGFLTLDNAVLTPHLGSATSDTRTRMADEVFANVQAFLDGRPLSDVAA